MTEFLLIAEFQHYFKLNYDVYMCAENTQKEGKCLQISTIF